MLIEALHSAKEQEPSTKSGGSPLALLNFKL